MYRYYPTELSDNVYIEIEECYPHDYDIQRCVEMTKEEYELSWEGEYFGERRNITNVFYEKKVPIKMLGWEDE